MQKFNVYIDNCDFAEPEKVCIWSDGTWCYLSELHEMGHMSDDFYIIRFEDHDLT